MTQQQCILTSLLKCGSMDLELLEQINYDLDDILGDLLDNGMLNLNELFSAVFQKGQSELQNIIDERKTDLINEIEGLTEQDAEYEELNQELLDLDNLSLEDDFSWFTNCLDTHIFLVNLETYKKYFADEISDIENKMGFEF